MALKNFIAGRLYGKRRVCTVGVESLEKVEVNTPLLHGNLGQCLWQSWMVIIILQKGTRRCVPIIEASYYSASQKKSMTACARVLKRRL